MDRLLVRVGSPNYARSNKSFGVTTLRNRHLKTDGTSLRLIFKGKSGKDWNLKISDRRIARIIRSLQELPGQHLFQYLDNEGQRHAISSQDINDYLRDVTKADFTSKHFRTGSDRFGCEGIVSLAAARERRGIKAGAECGNRQDRAAAL